jgi:cytochrome c-type biogenesis protein
VPVVAPVETVAAPGLGLLADLAESFGLGLATPLGAVCVLPLYPGFLAFLSNRPESGASVRQLGALVAVGVVGLMFVVGVVFSTLLSTSLTVVIEAISPVAFAVLAVGSLLLLAGVEIERHLPTVEPPRASRPRLSALGYGLFFGAIVLPCNPAFIAVFLGRALLFTEPVASLLNFLAFGAGMAAPLLGLALVSDRYSDLVIGTLTRHSGLVNRLSGAVMLVVSVYYLVFVFDLLPVAV